MMDVNANCKRCRCNTLCTIAFVSSRECNGFHVLCRRCTAAQRACWIRRKPNSGPAMLTGVLGAWSGWQLFRLEIRGAHRLIWKKPMKMIGQSGAQENCATQLNSTQQKTWVVKVVITFFASKKQVKQAKQINLSQFKGGKSLWRRLKAQANVTHFSQSDEPFVELGDGSLESKWSQLLLPEGQIARDWCQDFWFMSWILLEVDG